MRAITPPGQEGWLRDQEKAAKLPSSRRRGGCSTDSFCRTLVHHPAAHSLVASQYLLMFLVRCSPWPIRSHLPTSYLPSYFLHRLRQPFHTFFNLLGRERAERQTQKPFSSSIREKRETIREIQIPLCR